MSHLEHPDALVDERSCQGGHFFARPRIKVGRYLVKHEIAGMHRDNARNGDKLLLAA